ncbi:MAG: NUDIX domain-containing protein [Erysipelotrichaceae bacterium]|nr:NUDIX domain-containing protein [Erysipelotrichaceae bacterium]
MKHITSAGGVVFHERRVLVLKKINGDWVLPKGKIEQDETPEDAATREVFEETGIEAKIINYLAETGYRFRNVWSHQELVEKRVHWYSMIAQSTSLVPLEEEGFVEARFVESNEIDRFLRYEDERDIVRKAVMALEIV